MLLPGGESTLQLLKHNDSRVIQSGIMQQESVEAKYTLTHEEKVIYIQFMTKYFQILFHMFISDKYLEISGHIHIF